MTTSSMYRLGSATGVPAPALFRYSNAELTTPPVVGSQVALVVVKFTVPVTFVQTPWGRWKP